MTPLTGDQWIHDEMRKVRSDVQFGLFAQGHLDHLGVDYLLIIDLNKWK